MTLTTRLLCFSLATLGFVLAGFSAALVEAAREYLNRQSHARLEAAASTLVAACEVGPGGVEWEPGERSLALPSGPAGDPVAWRVADDRGRSLGRSETVDDELFSDPASSVGDPASITKRTDRVGNRWRVRRQWLVAPPDPPTIPVEGVRYPAVSITVAVSLEPDRAALRELGTVLAGLSATVWVAALVVGRRVCRWALRPLARMAETAGGMGADDLGRRLPLAGTGDELDALAGAFNGLLDRVGVAYDRQRRFTAEASHQLRTPLAAILGQVDVALRRERDGDEYRRVLGTVREQADRLRRVTDALLFLARADADARLPDRERLDLGEWLADHVQRWADHPRAGDLTVVPDGPASADASSVLLGELVDVLVDNAFKHTLPGTSVVVRTRSTAEGAELSVEDAGPGIDPDELPRLFDPFFRSAAARTRGVEGFGLGLSVAARIAAAHGGRLAASAPSGGGIAFTLSLPRLGDAAVGSSRRMK